MNNHFNKRGRNNHQRRRQGVNPNRALDSNGPDVRIRGTAQQIYDKYLTLARDATSAGDRVKAENYLQHAEHYFRVLRATQGPQAPAFDPSQDGDMDGGDQPTMSDQRDMRDQRQPQTSFDADEADAENAASHPGDAQPNGAGDDRAQDARGGDSRPQGGGDHESRRRRRRPRRPREEGGGEDAAPDEPAPEPVNIG